MRNNNFISLILVNLFFLVDIYIITNIFVEDVTKQNTSVTDSICKIIISW